MAPQTNDPATPQAHKIEAAGRLFFLKVSPLSGFVNALLDPIGTVASVFTGSHPFGGKIVSVNPDGTDAKIIVGGLFRIPDGIQVDVANGHIYWTNMGFENINDGSIQRADLDGGNITTIVPVGATFTPKQLKLDRKNGKLYWSDREGMRVMRANLDGSKIEALVETGQGEADRRDPTNWCVGIAIDTGRGQIYWTQKGPDHGNKGRIFRANLEIPKGESPAARSDVVPLFCGLPEPIDLDLDLANRMIYWSDRGDPPRGNSVNRAPMDASGPGEPQVLLGGLEEGIGLSLDIENGRMFFTDLGGTVYRALLDGSKKSKLLRGQGKLTGITYAAPLGG